ncbi:import atp-binding protein [Holotrichia oblita]|nr:import atp-binding protein [Holotrichia oblita]
MVFSSGSIKTHALKGISFEIQKGAFCCITDASGHGKSTLLQLVGGHMKPTSGKVFIDGVDISALCDTALSEIRAKKIGVVFQFFNLLPYLTVRENIQVAMMFTKLSAKKQRERAADLLEYVGLSEKANARPNELSGGQQQRIAIARALANDSDILLLDEPTGSLDSEMEEDILAQIKKTHKLGKTIVIVTHNKEIAKQADIHFEVFDGRLKI